MPPALKLYRNLLLALWAFSALLLALPATRPQAAALFWLQPPFYDFGCYYDRIKLLHQAIFWTAPGPSWDYPAPSIFVYQLFYAFNRGNGGDHKVFFGFLAYLLFAAAVLLISAYLLTKALRRRGIATVQAATFIAIALLLCWPAYFGMQRGNIEFFLDAGIAVALYAYVSRRYWLFAVLLGVFGSGKLYPLVLLSLLLPLRRWKELAGGITTAAALSLLASRWIGSPPKVNNKSFGVVNGLVDWVQANSLTFDAHLSGFDHSIFGSLKLLNQGHPQRFALWAGVYAVIASIAMLLLFFGRIWKLPRPNQLLMVSLTTMLLPPTSFDYTLTLLLPAWAWLVILHARRPSRGYLSRGSILTVAAFAVLFAPDAFATWHGALYAGQLKLLALLVLLVIAAIVPFPEEDARAFANNSSKEPDPLKLGTAAVVQA